MKKNAFTIVDLIKFNRETLGKIKSGNKSLCWNPLAKGVKEKGFDHFDVRNQAVLLITSIIRESTDCLEDGLNVLKETKQIFISYHEDEDE